MLIFSYGWRAFFNNVNTGDQKKTGIKGYSAQSLARINQWNVNKDEKLLFALSRCTRGQPQEFVAVQRMVEMIQDMVLVTI